MPSDPILNDTSDHDPASPPQAKKIKASSHIPRPRNAFILFRTDFVQSKKLTKETEADHRNISKIVGAIWRSLSDSEKIIWQEKAKEEKARHKRLYPDYKYIPTEKRARDICRRKIRPSRAWEGLETDDGTDEGVPVEDNSTALSVPCVKRGSRRTISECGCQGHPQAGQGSKPTTKKRLTTVIDTILDIPNGGPQYPSRRTDRLSERIPDHLPPDETQAAIKLRKRDRCEVIAQLYLSGVQGKSLENEVKQKEAEGRRKRLGLTEVPMQGEEADERVSRHFERPFNFTSLDNSIAPLSPPPSRSSDRPLKRKKYFAAEESNLDKTICLVLNKEDVVAPAPNSPLPFNSFLLQSSIDFLSEWFHLERTPSPHIPPDQPHGKSPEKMPRHSHDSQNIPAQFSRPSENDQQAASVLVYPQLKPLHGNAYGEDDEILTDPPVPISGFHSALTPFSSIPTAVQSLLPSSQMAIQYVSSTVFEDSLRRVGQHGYPPVNQPVSAVTQNGRAPVELGGWEHVEYENLPFDSPIPPTISTANASPQSYRYHNAIDRNTDGQLSVSPPIHSPSAYHWSSNSQKDSHSESPAYYPDNASLPQDSHRQPKPSIPRHARTAPYHHRSIHRSHQSILPSAPRSAPVGRSEFIRFPTARHVAHHGSPTSRSALSSTSSHHGDVTVVPSPIMAPIPTNHPCFTGDYTSFNATRASSGENFSVPSAGMRYENPQMMSHNERDPGGASNNAYHAHSYGSTGNGIQALKDIPEYGGTTSFSQADYDPHSSHPQVILASSAPFQAIQTSPYHLDTNSERAENSTWYAQDIPPGMTFDLDIATSAGTSSSALFDDNMSFSSHSMSPQDLQSTQGTTHSSPYEHQFGFDNEPMMQHTESYVPRFYESPTTLPSHLAEDLFENPVPSHVGSLPHQSINFQQQQQSNFCAMPAQNYGHVSSQGIHYTGSLNIPQSSYPQPHVSHSYQQDHYRPNTSPIMTAIPLPSAAPTHASVYRHSHLHHTTL